MATVSEIFWYKTRYGKCSQCGRERDLGMVNDKAQPQFKDRCIDCCFGPPMEYWDMCDACGQLYVGEHCDNPRCEEGSNAPLELYQKQQGGKGTVYEWSIEENYPNNATVT